MNPEDFTELRLFVGGGVAVVELNRPDQRNAWSGRMAVEYRWALHLADIDEDARVVIVTGAGDDFCAGAAVEALDAISEGGGVYERDAAGPAPFPPHTPEELQRNHAYPWSLSVPVIAAINGTCAGAGFVLATYADLRFAADDAKIATSFAGLGLPAEYGTGWVLPRLMGVPNAFQLLYHPGSMSAERARELGYVQRVIEAARLRDETMEFAENLVRRCAPTSLRVMKRALLFESAGGFGPAYTSSVAAMDEAFRGEEFHTAMRARRQRARHDFRSTAPPS